MHKMHGPTHSAGLGASVTLEIRPFGRGFAVYDPQTNQRLSPSQKHDITAARANHLEAARSTELQAKVRPCLTCRAPFLSEGKHNRMCPDCRRTALGKDMWA